MIKDKFGIEFYPGGTNINKIKNKLFHYLLNEELTKSPDSSFSQLFLFPDIVTQNWLADRGFTNISYYVLHDLLNEYKSYKKSNKS